MKFFLLLVFLTFIYQISFSQEQVVKERERFRITTTPQQYIFLDFPFTFEKVFRRATIGITLSYRPDTKDGGEVEGGGGLGGDYSYQNFRNPLYQMFTIGLNSKYYISKNTDLFIEGHIFFRRWWFDDKYAKFDNVEGYRFEGMRTERQDVYGLKLLFGNTFLLKSKYAVKPVIDVYWGLGIRQKEMLFETRNGYVNDVYYAYQKEKDSHFPGLPSVHFGVRLGIGVK